MALKCLAMRKFQNLAVLAFATAVLISTLLYSFNIHPRVGLLAHPLSHRPLMPTPCGAVSNVSISGQMKNLWPFLQHLFDTHNPAPETYQKDFPEGQTDSPSFESLNKHLPIGRPEAENARSIHKHLVSKIPAMPQGVFHGRGVVILSNAEQLQYAATSIGMLQLLKSRLPVELWMLNHSSAKGDWCMELISQGVACRFISDYVQNATGILEFSHQHTAAALLFSSFAEILYLDSDTFTVINPDNIFDCWAFTSTGALLWPDFWKPTESPWTHYITGFSNRVQTKVSHYHTADSALMVWDKKKHWQTLVLALYYNYHGPKYFYNLITQGGPKWGGKDTFATALRANPGRSPAPYHVVPHYLAQVGLNNGKGGPRGSGVCVLQADPYYPNAFQAMFLHTSILRFGVRDLMCDTSCIKDEPYTRPNHRQRLVGQHIRDPGIIMDPKDSSHSLIHGRQRLLAQSQLTEKGVDPEESIWKVLERLSCTDGAWMHKKLCNNVRSYMNGTFGVVEYWRSDKTLVCRL